VRRPHALFFGPIDRAWLITQASFLTIRLLLCAMLSLWV
jgi:hypothetical protein